VVPFGYLAQSGLGQSIEKLYAEQMSIAKPGGGVPQQMP
jgi:hypothetical protein